MANQFLNIPNRAISASNALSGSVESINRGLSPINSLLILLRYYLVLMLLHFKIESALINHGLTVLLKQIIITIRR